MKRPTLFEKKLFQPGTLTAEDEKLLDFEDLKYKKKKTFFDGVF